MQAQEGSSLDEQKKKIEAWAILNNMKLMGIWIDKGISGTFMFQRPEFAKMFALIEIGDTIVANDLSRVSRNVKDTADLIERLDALRANIIFIKDGLDMSTSMGRAMIQMSSVMKAMEVNYTSERVKDTLASMKEKGQNTTRPSYGWTKESHEKGSRLIEVPEQQEVIRRMKKMHAEGMSYNAIAEQLSYEGIETPSGKNKTWNHYSVSKIINRKDVATKGRYDK